MAWVRIVALEAMMKTGARATGRLTGVAVSLVILLTIVAPGAPWPSAPAAASPAERVGSSPAPVIGLDTVDRLAELATFHGPSSAAHSHALSPDGSLLAVSGPDRGESRPIDVRRVADGSLLVRLEGHQELVWSLAFSPDGALLASGSEDGTVRIWRLASGALERTLSPGSTGVKRVLFSPDGLLVAAGMREHRLAIWRVADGELVRAIDTNAYTWVDALAFSPDGRSIATGDADAPRIWPLDEAAPPRDFAEPPRGLAVESVAYSPDGRWLAGTTMTGLVVVWKTDDGSVAQVMKAHEHGGGAALFAPGGDLLITDGSDGTLCLWRVGDWSLVRTLRFRYDVGGKEPTISADGRTLALRTSNDEVTVWRIVNWARPRAIVDPSGVVTRLVYSRDGAFFATGSKDAGVRIWRASDGVLLRKLDGHEGIVLGFDLSPDGSLIASGSMDWTVRIWRVADGGLVARLDDFGSSVESVAFSPDGRLLAAGSQNGELRVTRVEDGSTAYRVQGRDEVSAVAFSPDGRLLAIPGPGDTMRLLDAANGSDVDVLHGQPDHVHGLAFSPDGQLLVAGGLGGYVRAWRVADRTLLRTFGEKQQGIEGVRFSPDGSLLAAVGSGSGSSGYTQVWRVADGVALWPETRLPSTVFGVDFSPDGATLATSDDDGAVRFWDAASGQFVRSSGSGIFQTAISPTGQRLTAVDADRQVRSWQLADPTVFRRFTLPGKWTAWLSVEWPTGVALAPDATWLAMVADGWPTAPVEIWSVDEQRTVQTLPAVDDLAMLLIPPVSRRVLVVDSPSTQLVPLDGGEALPLELTDVTGTSIQSSGNVAFSADGRRFAVVEDGWKGRVVVWSLDDGRLLWSHRFEDNSVQQVSAVAFSQDGQTVATSDQIGGRSGTISFFRAADGLPTETHPDDRAGYYGEVTALAFSPDGALLAIGRENGQVELRQLSDWTVVRTLVGHRGKVRQVLFGADSATVVTTSEDGSMLVWAR